MKRPICLLCYYVVAYRLPDYNFPLGDLWRRVRGYFCRRLLASAGAWINVEGQVFIGDGRWISLGDGSSLGHGSRVYGVKVGRNVMVGPNCTFLKDNHVFADVTRPIRGQGLSAPACPIIEDDAWIGEKVIILPGRRIGGGAVVGAGAVVTRDVAPFDIVAGNPAKPVGSRLTGDSTSDTATPATEATY